MVEAIPGNERVTLGADKGYDVREFVKELRQMNVTPHIAQNGSRPGGSAIDRVKEGSLGTLNGQKDGTALESRK